jgi:hypothetical protein
VQNPVFSSLDGASFEEFAKYPLFEDRNWREALRLREDAEKLVQELTGLFAGGELAEEDMDALAFAVQAAYVEAKKNNKKYTPKKYRQDASDEE